MKFQRNKFSQFFWDTVNFSTLFNEVVRWDEWGEVENVYVA